MSKFNVGDIVRRIDCYFESFHGMKIGDVATVKRTDGWRIELHEYSGHHDPAMLELVYRGTQASDTVPFPTHSRERF